MSDHTNESEATELVYIVNEDERPSGAVIQAISTLTDTPTLDMDPLFDAIDPDHLDGIFTDRSNIRQERELSFYYHGCHVTVTRDSVCVRTDSPR